MRRSCTVAILLLLVSVASGQTRPSLLQQFANQSANQCLCGPSSGGAATPGFRAHVAADIPALDIYALLNGRAGTANDLILSTSGNGTISGSTSVSGQLNLQAASGSPSSAAGQTINLLPNIGNIGSGAVLFLAEPGSTLKFNATSSRVIGLGMGFDANITPQTWLVNVGNLNTSGSQQLGFVASQIVQNTPSGTGRQLGKWALVANDLTFFCDGAGASCTVGEMITLQDQTGPGITNGATANTMARYVTVQSQALPGAGTKITERKGFEYQEQSSGALASVPTDIAFDVYNQLSSDAFTTAAALRTGMLSGAQKWNVLDTGGAQWALKGALTLNTSLGGLKLTTVAAPGTPTVTPQGTTGGATWGYKVTCVTPGGETPASTEGTTTTGNLTLTSSNYNHVVWNTGDGCISYKVYRTNVTGGGTHVPATTGFLNSYDAFQSGQPFYDDKALDTAGAAAPTVDRSATIVAGGSPASLGGVATDIRFGIVLPYPALEFKGAASSVLEGLAVGIDATNTAQTWTISANNPGVQGAVLFNMAPNIINSPATSSISRTTGTWAELQFGPTFNVDASDGTNTFTVTAADMAKNVVTCGRTATGGNTSSAVITALTSVNDAPAFNTGCTTTTRRGLWFQAPAGSGSQTTAVGLDCADQSATTLACMRSSIASGAGKYGVRHIGTAQSILGGNTRIGDATDPTATLDVLGKYLVDSNGNITKINNVATSFPVTQGAAGSFWRNDGSGNLSWSPTVPAFRACGADQGGTGTVQPGLPTGHVANDILLLFIQSANEAGTCPAGYTQIGPQSGTGTAAASGATRLTVCWKRDNGSESAPTVVDSGNHTYAVLCAFSGVNQTGDPFHFLSSGVKATASTSTSATGGATSVDATFVVVAVANAVSAAGTAQYSAEANSDLGSLTEQFDKTTNTGVGGGLMVTTGTKSTAGAIGATTATVTSSAEAFATLVLIPNDSPQLGRTPRACDVQSFTACGVTSGNCPNDTWVKPTGAKTVDVIAIGGGGAGGAGRSAATAAGGGGGGGGGYQRAVFQADQLQSTLTVTVGRGGIGGATANAGTASTVTDNSLTIVSAGFGAIGAAAASGDGGDGGSGGSVGSVAAQAVSGTGAAGVQGLGGSGGAGGGGGTVTTSWAGGKGDMSGGGGGSGATAANTGGVGGTSNFGGGGGGGGDVSGAGGAGGVGGQGKAAGAAHANATSSGVMTMGGSGGGGGDATTTGGNGAQPGGGGGGGGNATGSGGNGADGAVTILTCF